MDFFKTPTGKIILIGIVIVVIYYIISPYQNCMREFPGAPMCVSRTSW
mgnify:CR=1 FL=1